MPKPTRQETKILQAFLFGIRVNQYFAGIEVKLAYHVISLENGRPVGLLIRAGQS